MKKTLFICLTFLAAIATHGNPMHGAFLFSDITFPVLDEVISVGNVDCVGKETRTDQFESCDDFNPPPRTCNFDGTCVDGKCRDGDNAAVTETVEILQSGAATKVPKWPADGNVPNAQKVQLTLDDYVSCYKKKECYCANEGFGMVCHPGDETVYKLARLSKSDVKCPPARNGDELGIEAP